MHLQIEFQYLVIACFEANTQSVFQITQYPYIRTRGT